MRLLFFSFIQFFFLRSRPPAPSTYRCHHAYGGVQRGPAPDVAAATTEVRAWPGKAAVQCAQGEQIQLLQMTNCSLTYMFAGHTKLYRNLWFALVAGRICSRWLCDLDKDVCYLPIVLEYVFCQLVPIAL